MKFQNPSFKVYERTDGCTHARTEKPKAICSPLFQSWGRKTHNTKVSIQSARTVNRFNNSFA